MSYFRDLADDHTDLSYSPLLRVAQLTLQYTQDHGPIGLTKTGAFQRAFVKWAAEHFDWPGMSRMNATRHLIRFVATTNHESRIVGAQILQSFLGTARDLLEETVMASKAVMP